MAASRYKLHQHTLCMCAVMALKNIYMNEYKDAKVYMHIHMRAHTNTHTDAVKSAQFELTPHMTGDILQ